MHEITRMLSQGGGYSVLILAMSGVALPVGLAGLIVSMVSKKRRPGIIIGYIGLGLSLVMLALGILGHGIGMTAASGYWDFAAPAQLPMAASQAVAAASSSVALALLLGGLPFLLSVLAISRSASRPVSLGQGFSADSDLVAGGGGAIAAAILPGLCFFTGMGTLMIQRQGVRGLVDVLGSGMALSVLFFSVIVTVILSILGPKVVRGNKIPVAALVLLGAVPWLSSFWGSFVSSIQAFNALESAAPDQRAAALASGISVSLDLQALSATLSGYLLLALGLVLALGARQQKAGQRRGLNISVAAITALPLAAMAVLTIMAMGAAGVVMLLGAIVAIAIIVLGASGIGNDSGNRSVSLGVGAALAAGLGFAALTFAASSNVTSAVFHSLVAVSPDQRQLALTEGATHLNLFFTIRDYGWIVAILPALVLALVSMKQIRLESGGLQMAGLASFIFLLAPVLSLMMNSFLSIPDWSKASSPWYFQEKFKPPVTTSVACDEGYHKIHAVIGLRQITMLKPLSYSVEATQRRLLGGYEQENIGSPEASAVMEQLAEKFKLALAYKPKDNPAESDVVPEWLKKDEAMGSKGKRLKGYEGQMGKVNTKTKEMATQDGILKYLSTKPSEKKATPGPKLYLAIDHRLPVEQFNKVMRAAEVAGAGSVELMGTEYPIIPADPRPTGRMHPLLLVYSTVFSGPTCSLSVPVGKLPERAFSETIWEGKVGFDEEVKLSVRSLGAKGDAGDTGTFVVSNRSRGYGDYPGDVSKDSKGYALLTGETDINAGRLISAAAAAKSNSYIPIFSDPKLVPVRKVREQASGESSDVGVQGNSEAAPGADSIGVPRIRSGAAMVKGSLSKEVVRRIVHRHINEVKYCYERRIVERPSLSGRMSVKFIISGTGAVQMAAVAASTLGDPLVENCIVKAVRRWTFPQPEGGGIVIVTYPFLLTAPQG